MIDENKWKEIGDLSKNIKRDLIRLAELSRDVKMRKKETDSIFRSINHLNKYRSNAENFMFMHGVKDLKIFFGDSE